MKLILRGGVLWALMIGAVFVLSSQPAAAQSCPDLLGLWPYGPAKTVAISGDRAYVGSGAALLVIDVSTPASPVLLGDVVLPDIVRGVTVVGDYAFVVCGDSGLRVVSVSITVPGTWVLMLLMFHQTRWS